MNGFRVIAMSDALADEVRATRKAPDYGHPAHAEDANGPWPCRVCLERKAPDPERPERRILFTFDLRRG